MRQFMTVVLCAALSACAHTCPPQMLPPPELSAPVYRPERPELPAATLQPSDTPDTVVRSLIMTIEILQGYAEALEAYTAN